jgi:hypothetical protein
MAAGTAVDSVIMVRRMQNGSLRAWAVKSRAFGATRCGFGT